MHERLARARRSVALAGLDPPAWRSRRGVRERAGGARASSDDGRTLARAAGDDAARAATRLDRASARGRDALFPPPRAAGTRCGERVLPERRLRGARSRGAGAPGCATGEEAWTLAMLLAERGAARSRCWATDLSTAALARRAAGATRPARVRRTCRRRCARATSRRSARRACVNDRLRAQVRFERAQPARAAAAAARLRSDPVPQRAHLLRRGARGRGGGAAGAARCGRAAGCSSATRRRCAISAELTAEAHAVYRRARRRRWPRMTAAAIATRVRRRRPTPVTRRRGRAHDRAPAADRRASCCAATTTTASGWRRSCAPVVGAAARRSRSRRRRRFLGDDAARVLRRAVEAAPRPRAARHAARGAPLARAPRDHACDEPTAELLWQRVPRRGARRGRARWRRRRRLAALPTAEQRRLARRAVRAAHGGGAARHRRRWRAPRAPPRRALTDARAATPWARAARAARRLRRGDRARRSTALRTPTPSGARLDDTARARRAPAPRSGG